MNFIDSLLSKPPLPTFSQFTSDLYSHDLRARAYGDEKVRIKIWHSMHTRNQTKEDMDLDVKLANPILTLKDGIHPSGWIYGNSSNNS